MKKIILIVGLVLVSLVGYGQSEFELEVLRVLNEVRVSKGLAKVTWDYNFPQEIIDFENKYVERQKNSIDWTSVSVYSRPYNYSSEGYGHYDAKYTIEEIKEHLEIGEVRDLKCIKDNVFKIFIKEYWYLQKITNKQLHTILFFVNYDKENN